VTETTTIPAGQVTRQTISVAVNSDVVTSMDAATIRGLVEAAAGVDTTRGDDVQVELVSFTKPDATEAAAALAAAAAQEQQNNIVKIITTAVPFVGVALVLIILLSAFRGKRRKKGEEELDLGAFAASRESMEATALAVAAAAANLPIAAAPPATPVTPDSPASPAYPAALPGDGAENESLGGIDRMRLEIDNLAAVSPERTADYLRGLMDDRTRA
jgi:flagellar M-ring protein FliF